MVKEGDKQASDRKSLIHGTIDDVTVSGRGMFIGSIVFEGDGGGSFERVLEVLSTPVVVDVAHFITFAADGSCGK